MSAPAVNRYFLPYQVDAIMEESRLVLWEKSIRIGATFAMAFRAVRRRVLGLGNYLHTSVNERIAKSFVDQCKKFCEVFEIAASEINEFSAYNPLTDRQESAFEIRFGQCAIKAFSSNPDALRGEGGEVGIDELSSHQQPDEMLKAAGGRAMWGYPVTVWTSHAGEDSAFNRLVKQERAKGAASQWKIRSTTLYDALDQGLLAKINETRQTECRAAGVKYADLTREQFIDQTIAMVGGEEAFAEECLLQPRKGGGSAIKWSLLDAARQDYPCARIAMTESATQINDVMLNLATSSRSARLALGFDVARTGDLSSAWINAREGDGRWRLRGLITMRGMKFGVQRQVIATLMQAFPTMVGAGDATGLGMQICEELKEQFGEHRFTGMNFSAMKPDLGTKMVRVYEDGRQILPAGPRNDDIAYDLAAIRTEPLPSGRVRFYETPNPIEKASHCDLAWSNALALYVGDDESQEQAIYTLSAA